MHLTGVDDHSFGLVFSVFGAMSTPKPSDITKKTLRGHETWRARCDR